MDALTLFFVSGTLVSICGVFDAAVKNNRFKNTLHFKMTAWWYRLDGTQIPDLAILMANWVIDAGKRIFRWPMLSWQTALSCVVASWVLTSTASLFVLLIPSTKIFPPKLLIPLPIFTNYIVNFPLDLATIFVTVGALIIVKNKNRFIGFFIIMVDIIVAITLSILCFALIQWADNIAFTYELPGSAYVNELMESNLRANLGNFISDEGFSNNARIKIYMEEESNIIYCFSKAPRRFFRMLFYGYFITDTTTVLRIKDIHKYNDEQIIIGGVILYPKYESAYIEYHQYLYNRGTADWFSTILSITTLVPTFLYMALLMVMIIAKFLLETIKNFCMKFIEKFTPADPKDIMPASLFGFLFFMYSSIGKNYRMDHSNLSKLC